MKHLMLVFGLLFALATPVYSLKVRQDLFETEGSAIRMGGSPEEVAEGSSPTPTKRRWRRFEFMPPDFQPNMTTVFSCAADSRVIRTPSSMGLDVWPSLKYQDKWSDLTKVLSKITPVVDAVYVLCMNCQNV